MTTRKIHVAKGLGPLKAYIGIEEGVAFQMDNKLIWDSLGKVNDLAIQGVLKKKESSKFEIILLPSQKVMLKERSGMYLASKSSRENPNIYHIILVLPSDDKSLQFDVFHSDNEVAFRDCNGLFLSRVERVFHTQADTPQTIKADTPQTIKADTPQTIKADTPQTIQADTPHPLQTDIFHTIEAVKKVADDRCCFRPMIGNLRDPTFKILEVTTDEVSEDTGSAQILREDTFVNRSDVPQRHTYIMTWETEVLDRIIWKHLWGLGIASSCQFTIGKMTATLQYTESNDKAIFLIRKIYEKLTREVEVPPKSKTTACLVVKKLDRVVVPFTATIRKMKSNGDVVTLQESGTWRGLLYFDIYLDIKSDRLPDQCTAM